MFGVIIGKLYETFHQGNRFLTNISAVVDDDPSPTLGKIVIDVFDKEGCVPACSFVFKLSIFESEDKKKTARRCIVEQIELSHDMDMQEMTTVITMARNATTGIMNRPEEVLFSFEKNLTSLGGYIMGAGITDVVYSENLQTYLRRANGTLLQVEVQTEENAHRTYSIDAESLRNNKINVENTFSGNYLNLILGMTSKYAPESKKPEEFSVLEKDTLQKLAKLYMDASQNLDTGIVGALASYYNANIAKWSGKVYLGRNR